MRNIRNALAVATIALTATASAASAQIGLSLAGGPTVAMGALSDVTDMGYHAQLSAGLSVPLLPFGVRVDGMFTQFPETGEGGDFRVLSGSVNGVLSMPSIGITPYLIGGVGVYNSKWIEDENLGHDHGEEASTTNVGANIGAGVRFALPGLAVFGEARLHNLFNEGEATRFAPISLGIRF